MFETSDFCVKTENLRSPILSRIDDRLDAFDGELISAAEELMRRGREPRFETLRRTLEWRPRFFADHLRHCVHAGHLRRHEVATKHVLYEPVPHAILRA